MKFEAEKAEREGDYGKVAEIRYGKLQALENEIKDIQEDLKHKQGDSAMIKEEVTAEDIGLLRTRVGAEAIAEVLGIKEPTVRTRLVRARKLLKQSLKEAWEDEQPKLKEAWEDEQPKPIQSHDGRGPCLC